VTRDELSKIQQKFIKYQKYNFLHNLTLFFIESGVWEIYNILRV